MLRLPVSREQQRDREQHEQRRHGADQQVLQGGPGRQAAAPHGHQGVAGERHHLHEHEQVEQVAGDAEADHAAAVQQQQRVEDRSTLEGDDAVEVAPGERDDQHEQRRERQDPGAKWSKRSSIP
jgi:hypothetical protein